MVVSTLMKIFCLTILAAGHIWHIQGFTFAEDSPTAQEGWRSSTYLEGSQDSGLLPSYTVHKRRHHHGLISRRDGRFSGHISRRDAQNQHVPTFSHSGYQKTVGENVPPGTSILQVEATDDDPGTFGIILYEVTDPSHFYVDDGGVIYSKSRLDYEGTGGQYNFYVYASNPGSTRNYTTRVPISIRVLDEPEGPLFDSARYSFQISEFAKLGDYVGTVVAIDADGDFDQYSLESVSPVGQFDVDQYNGIITLGSNLLGDTWTFSFNAAAVDLEGNTNVVPVDVDIIDENTHRPTFKDCSSYDGHSVPENETVPYSVLNVTATDDDHGKNGEVTYYLLGEEGSFQIDSKTGQLSTIRVLDRDQGDKTFYLTVTAKDGADMNPLEGACSFNLLVRDINDNPPLFDQSMYQQKVPVDQEINSAILRVTASDSDAGENALIAFDLDGTPEDLAYFSIDQVNSKTFMLVARATDGGEPSLTSTAGVEISVAPSGQIPPSVDTIVSAPLSEDSPSGTNVATICALSNIQNPDLFFYLINGNSEETNSENTFSIQSDTDSTTCSGNSQAGIISLESSVDYETIQSYSLIVRIINDNNAAFDYKLQVNITDINDNLPIPQQPYQGSISENDQASIVMPITAIDKDVSPEFRNLTYRIVNTDSDVLQKFRVDSTLGYLWTTQPLDREEINIYKIRIEVTDQVPGHEKTTVYFVTVNDVNDEPPKFNTTLGGFYANVTESTDVNSTTGIRLRNYVYDPDIVNEFSFQIIGGNEQEKFFVQSKSGEIFVTKPLNYDSPDLDRNFTLNVRVSDGIAYDDAKVFISIINVNDLRPIFTQTSYSFEAIENVECGVEKLKVEAIDPDLPREADQNIAYFLLPDNMQNFTIGSQSGVLSIQGISIYANDEGGAGLPAMPAPVQINILDVNDNHPYIQSPEHGRTIILENQDPSMVKPITIKLSDKDTPAYGCPCTLVIDPSNEPSIMEKFSVTLNSSQDSQYHLQPLLELDREEQKEYKIFFNTTDRDGATGLRILTIVIGDLNDSPMSDGSSKIKAYNYMGSFPTTLIGSVYVTDADDFDVDDKTFEFDPQTDPTVLDHFEVNNSGNVTMLRGTPGGMYVLIVKVVDNARNEVATGTVTVDVLDLPEEAVLQSASFRINGISSTEFITQTSLTVTEGSSLHDRMKVELGKVYGIPSENVEIFTLQDVTINGEMALDVRFNCHGSPYFSAARLHGLLLANKATVETNLDITIPVIDLNECLYESQFACSEQSCQQELRVRGPAPINSDTSSILTVNVSSLYVCSCGSLMPLPRACPENFCLNGGTCTVINNALTCLCPDDSNYGPKCELLTAKMLKGYAWFEPLGSCRNASLSVQFESDYGNAVIFYNGPTLRKPWDLYPGDFLYVILRNWVFEVYMELGSGTMNVSLPMIGVKGQQYRATLDWTDDSFIVTVPECGMNSTRASIHPCRKSIPLTGPQNATRKILNVEAPLQLGGISASLPFSQLAVEYGWSLVPPLVEYFSGCFSLLKFNERIYDMNYTDYSKEFHRTCSDIRTEPVIGGGNATIFIIIGSLLALLLLVLLILLVTRLRKRKDLVEEPIKDFPMQTMGTTDVEGFGEKDMTQFDLKMLRVTDDGLLLNGTGPRGNDYVLPDVTKAARRPQTEHPVLQAPLAELPDGLSIGAFIEDAMKKQEQIQLQDPNVDDVRHYCYEGDEMSIASLSSLSSTTSEGDQQFDYLNDWGTRFERLAQMYGAKGDEEVDSDFEFPESVTKKPQKESYKKENAKSPTGSLRSKDGSLFRDKDYHETINPMSKLPGPESWC